MKHEKQMNKLFYNGTLGSSMVNVSGSRYKHWQCEIQSSSALGRKNGQAASLEVEVTDSGLTMNLAVSIPIHLTQIYMKEMGD